MTPAVVVGVDGSEAADHAVRWAAAHARRRNCALRAVYAWEYPYRASLPLGGSDPAPSTDAMREAAAAELSTALAAVRTPDLEIEEVVAEGYPSLVMMGAAEPGDVLVVGTRGRGALRQLLLGSTSRQVVTHATNTVVVVPRDAPLELDCVLVGVDGSDHAVAALRWALTLGAAEVVALHAWTVPTVFPLDTDAVAYQELERIAAADLDLTVHRATDGSPDAVRTILRYGDPRTQLTEVPDDIDPDLVVVGSRGHGPFGSAVLGSVSTFLLSHTELAVAVVHG